MTFQNSSDQKTFKNTFAPNVKNEEITIHDVLTGLRTTLLHFKDLPKEVQDAVEVELKKQSEKRSA